jgi:hypothetical protein
LEHAKEIAYNPKKDLSNGVLHNPIRDDLTPILRGFLTIGLSFYHNSCISGLNE